VKLPALKGQACGKANRSILEPQNIEQGMLKVEGRKSSFEILCSIFDIQSTSISSRYKIRCSYLHHAYGLFRAGDMAQTAAHAFFCNHPHNFLAAFGFDFLEGIEIAAILARSAETAQFRVNHCLVTAWITDFQSFSNNHGH
jgi:hypothetical protein